MKKARRWRWKVRHTKDCYAVQAVKRGDWNHPWAYIERESSFLNINAKRKGNYLYQELRCNCTQCPARILISVDAIAEILRSRP